MTEMRKDRRAPASLKVKYKSATVDDFIEQFGTDVSRGGIFIKTKKPLEAGALLKFEFQLQDGSAVLHGVGRVAWRRLEQQARPDLPAGMGIKFFKLSDQSRVVVERIESRFSGNKSRYEITDAAEFAPPLSGPPNVADSGANPLPGNDRRPGTGSAPRTLPPPPAVSSIPPALADVPPARAPAAPIRPSTRGATGPMSPMPKGTAGSFFPDTSQRKPSGPLRTSGSPVRTSGSPASRARDTSEFLASAFQAGGAGPEVRAQARAQAERARRDPESVDLARELFGDMGDAGAASLAAAPEAVGTNANNTPTQRPAPSGSPANDLGFATPVPAVELPRSPVPRNSRPSLADRIPSIEQLVDEGGRGDASPVSAAGASLSAAARASQPMAAAAAERPEPLKLAMQTPTFRPQVGDAEQPAGKSKVLLFVALTSTIVLGGAAAYVVMQRNAAQHAENAQAALEKTPPAAAPSEPSPAAATPAAAEPAAQPAAEPAPVAGPEVPVVIQAKPRDAEVWFGDKKQGNAPLTVKLPSNVPVEISVRSAGFATLTRSVTPREGATPESFELAPLSYQVVITTDPPGATIASGSASAVSPAPLDLGHLAGPAAVSIDKEGFQRSMRSVKLDEFREQDGVMRAEISLVLTPLPAARRRAPRAAVAPGAAVPAAAPPTPGDAPPAPETASPPPVMQVKPEGEPAEAPTPTPEAKAKPAEPPQTAAAPDPPPPPPPPEPAAN
jgi:uncharacterized protein (TIGR02266 family)